MTYWNQFDRNEIAETHGIESYNFIKDDSDFDHETDDKDVEQEFYCNRCKDAGCGWCNPSNRFD